MKKIWIIGIGRFGLLAVERLAKTYKDVSFVLADSEDKKFELIQYSNCILEQMDGVDFLNKRLFPENAPDWIIPALPVHLAAEWCLRRLGSGRAGRMELPPELDLMLPNAMRGVNGDMYITHADFLCPDDCSEPKNICTVTGEPRKYDMFKLLEKVEVPGFKSLVVRSHQLAPGVGGYRPQQLFDLLEQVKNAKSNMLVSTACRCHGVITGISEQ